MALKVTSYIGRIFEALSETNPQEIEALYHDLRSAGVIIPAGEGRSKGALSIPCSEMAKMAHGKIVVDRGDIGFPGRDIAEAAPALKKRYGQVCLLINSGTGKSLGPLLDAQKLGYYITTSGNSRDFRIDLITSDETSPLTKLSSKYGNYVLLKSRHHTEPSPEPMQIRASGIMEDSFTLASSLLVHSMAEAISEEAPPPRVINIASSYSSSIQSLVEEAVSSEFFAYVLDSLEERKGCHFAGLGSGQEVARMTAVRVAHVKKALGDPTYVVGETASPPPRAGDLLVVISHSGETEIVAGWCRAFKKMGGKIASILGNEKTTIGSLSDITLFLKTDFKPGGPNNFYVKAAFALSPLPLMLVERVEERGIELPGYIKRWYSSTTD